MTFATGMKSIGEAYMEMLFRLPMSRMRNRRPDVAFVPYSRWPARRRLPATDARDILPGLCVEVVSPHDNNDDMMTKLMEYFEAGARVVWVVSPRHRMIYQYESFNTVRVLHDTDTLNGGAILPGFELNLMEFFPDKES